MKKYLLFIAVSFLFYFSAHSQCIPAIPSNAAVIDSTQTINGGFTPAWICSGDTLISNGGIFKVFLEPGAVMTTGGGIDTIFVKKGASLFMNGGIHHIYYEDNNDLNLAGGIPTLDSCGSISFDYSNAPLNGCFTGPVAYFQSSDSTFCGGSCINFSDLSINATAWQWSFPGATPSTDTVKNPQNICYTTFGSFEVTLVASNSNGSDTLTLSNFITVDSVPAVTTTQNGNILSVTPGYASYQWYWGTVILNGATGFSLTAFMNGTYFVHITGANGCDTTVSIVFVNPGLNDFSYSETPFIITPNPAKDFFVITMNKNSKMGNKTADVTVIDALGKNVLSHKFNLNTTTEVALNNISPGIYFVKIITRDKLYVQRLLVE